MQEFLNYTYADLSFGASRKLCTKDFSLLGKPSTLVSVVWESGEIYVLHPEQFLFVQTKADLR